MNNKVDFLVPGEEYNPKGPDFDKIKDYETVE